MSTFFHLLTNCTFILELLNIDISLFILFSCQNHLIRHYLFYDVFSRKYSAKLKNYKVIMQTKKRNLWGKRQQWLKFQNYTLSEFIIYCNSYKKILKHLQSRLRIISVINLEIVDFLQSSLTVRLPDNLRSILAHAGTLTASCGWD